MLGYRNNVFPQAYVDDLVVVDSGCRPSQLLVAQHTIDMITRKETLSHIVLECSSLDALRFRLLSTCAEEFGYTLWSLKHFIFNRGFGGRLVKPFGLRPLRPGMRRSANSENLQDEAFAIMKFSNFNKIEISSCRNSIQGKFLITDDKGYVCSRHQVLRNGCCSSLSARNKRYECNTCNPEIHCCKIYEYCVSCCLDPEKEILLKDFLAKTNLRQTYESVKDKFEFCLLKCRTSSKSVRIEHVYKDPNAKYCYGEGPP
ncbi:C12orf49 [Cordylochernes scorpioides]|uniref:SREBP regulating gene protein n=1 Tax=Cordylochernes scorpioides TaxID=51811 RepID=A0ABY6LUG0_9ARAC|nr:C12orf49 [Cordylochernes scorpioides]